MAVRAGTPLGDDVTLNVLGPGVSFGEMALLVPGRHRTASIMAFDPVETLMLRPDRFEELCVDHPPQVRSLLVRVLANRVDDLSLKLGPVCRLMVSNSVSAC